MAQATLRSVIASAFRDQPYPKSAMENRSEDLSLEAIQVREFFRGRRWQDISRLVLSTYEGDERACLAFMSPKEFAYFLPAYLSVAIDVLASERVFAEDVLFLLLPSKKKVLQDLRDARRTELSLSQREVVARFIELVARVKNLQSEHAAEYWRSA